MGRRSRGFLPFSLASQSSDLLGPRAFPPAMSAPRENNLEILKLCIRGAMRAGARGPSE